MDKDLVKKIILIPRLNNTGGVANYYSVLKKYLDENFLYVYRGKSSKNKLFRLITDFARFYREIKIERIAQVVIISSSLGYGGFIRDGIYSLFAPGKTKKVIFIRGWNPDFEKKINNSFLLKHWLQKTFLIADHIIVLSSIFKKKLQDWGYKGPISIETTVVDEKLLANFTLNQKRFKKNDILFLSRIEKAKGIFEAVDAVNILLEQKRDIHLSIAGDGSAFEELKTHITNLNTDRISLKGYVNGDKKTDCFTSASLFLFPSTHGEGMPNSVLEAMAFGLPVVTTRVGGILDFFEEGKMGLFLDNTDPQHIADKIQYLLDRPNLMNAMSRYNYEYAKEHFYASKVAARLEKIINDVVEGKA